MANAISDRIKEWVYMPNTLYYASYLQSKNGEVSVVIRYNPEFEADRQNAYQERHYMAGRTHAVMFASRQYERTIQLKWEVMPEDINDLRDCRLAGHSETPLLYRGYGIDYFWGMPSNYHEAFDRSTGVWSISLTLTEVDGGQP